MRIENEYDYLTDLCNTNPAFYYTDITDKYTNHEYRIFNYRLAKYSDFTHPIMNDCRGIMFSRQTKGVVCRSIHKFFNYGEGGVEIPNHVKPVCVMNKLDGSLISTWIDAFGRLRLKTRGSISSVQVIDAYNWLCKSENRSFYKALKDITLSNYTVNLEWTSPNNRVVVGYTKESLRILNIRHNYTYAGEYILPNEDLFDWYINVDSSRIVKCEMPTMNLGSIQQRHGIEGFVVVFDNGLWLKYKTDWYSALHKTKDSIINDSALFEVCLLGQSDDLKSMFKDDEFSVNRIECMEKTVFDYYNNLLYDVDRFYERNRHLDRKSYAIAAKQYPWMSLAMNKFLCAPVNYNEYMMRNMKSIMGTAMK